MATIVEREVHHDVNDDTSVGSVIVGFLALVVILLIALYAFNVYPFRNNANNNAAAPSSNGSNTSASLSVGGDLNGGLSY